MRANPKPLVLSCSSVKSCCTTGVVEKALAGADDAATWGIWREARPSRPLDAEVVKWGAESILYQSGQFKVLLLSLYVKNEPTGSRGYRSLYRKP